MFCTSVLFSYLSHRLHVFPTPDTVDRQPFFNGADTIDSSLQHATLPQTLTSHSAFILLNVFLHTMFSQTSCISFPHHSLDFYHTALHHSFACIFSSSYFMLIPGLSSLHSILLFLLKLIYISFFFLFNPPNFQYSSYLSGATVCHLENNEETACLAFASANLHFVLQCYVMMNNNPQVLKWRVAQIRLGSGLIMSCDLKCSYV